ncbi:MAG TPA: hypothetical protein VF796_10665 [Humisphaera sp.]
MADGDEPLYFVTVIRDGTDVFRREPYADYAAAVAALSRFYSPRVPGSRATLKMTTEVISGVFARSYALLESPDRVPRDSPHDDNRLHIARRSELHFKFDGSYQFLIESAAGIRDADAWDND